MVSANRDSTGVTLETSGRFLAVSFANREVDKVAWSDGSTTSPLTVLPIWPNRELIYRGMDLYPKLLGTVCDGI